MRFTMTELGADRFFDGPIDGDVLLDRVDELAGDRAERFVTQHLGRRVAHLERSGGVQALFRELAHSLPDIRRDVR